MVEPKCAEWMLTWPMDRRRERVDTMASHQSKRDEPKHDEDRGRRERSFHWPPTSEELESIQVVAMSDLTREAQQRTPSHAMVRATLSQRTRLAKIAHDRDHKLAAPRPPASRRWFDGPVAAQAGLVAASLAAIGVAATSLLSPPQPVTSHGATKAPSAVTASAHTPAPAIAFPIASVSPRSPEAQPAGHSDSTTTATTTSVSGTTRETAAREGAASNGSTGRSAAARAAGNAANAAAARSREGVDAGSGSMRAARADARPVSWTGGGKA